MTKKVRKEKSSPHSTVVRARSDGRGGIKPFGSYGKNQAGAIVRIGNKSYRVTKDGRVNIPKKIMDKGIKGTDGRSRIVVTWSAEKGKEGWKNVSANVGKPLPEHKNKSSMYMVGNKLPKDWIKADDHTDRNWSP